MLNKHTSIGSILLMRLGKIATSRSCSYATDASLPQATAAADRGLLCLRVSVASSYVQLSCSSTLKQKTDFKRKRSLCNAVCTDIARWPRRVLKVVRSNRVSKDFVLFRAGRQLVHRFQLHGTCHRLAPPTTCCVPFADDQPPRGHKRSALDALFLFLC